MATVNGITAEKMQELADAFIVDGEVDLAGHLILTKAGGGTVDAGNVKGDDGLQGEPGIAGGYQLGAIGIWMSAVEPSWGKFLNGQTIVGGATTYSGLAALYPSWVSGANLVLPDWGTRTPVGYKAGDDTFFTLGAMMGAKTHTLTVQELPDHAHGSPGAAGATASGTADVKARGLSPGDTSFRTSASIYATGSYGSTVISGSRAHNNIQPSVVVNWVVCVATSSGDFDTEVQTALVSTVNDHESRLDILEASDWEIVVPSGVNALGSSATIDSSTGAVTIAAGCTRIRLDGILDPLYEIEIHCDLEVQSGHSTDNSMFMRTSEAGTVLTTAGYQTAGNWSQYNALTGVYAVNGGTMCAVGAVSGASSYVSFTSVINMRPMGLNGFTTTKNYFYTFESFTSSSARGVKAGGYTPSPTGVSDGVAFYFNSAFTGVCRGKIRVYRRRIL